MLKERKQDWKFLSLKHNPQFYLKFPDNTARFGSFSKVSHIPAIAFRSEVTKFKTLHVIVDRGSNSRRQISLRDRSKVALPDLCGNGWQLDDDEKSIAVKLKGRRQVVSNLKAVWSTYLSRPHSGNNSMEHGKPIWWSSISPLSHNPDRWCEPPL